MQLIRGINKILDRKRFTLAKYEEFLQTISKYKVLPLNEFRNYHNENEVVIGLRHDSDSNFRALEDMAWIEERNGIRSTIFVLHSAGYFIKDIIPSLLKIQSLGFEIGLHQDCMDSYLPEIRMTRWLSFLRDSGINIYGTSAHGDKSHKNIHFWEKYNKADFGIFYEAYELDHTQYYSDCTFIDGHRWHPLDINWIEINPGARIQILLHPEIWTNKLYL